MELTTTSFELFLFLMLPVVATPVVIMLTFLLIEALAGFGRLFR